MSAPFDLDVGDLDFEDEDLVEDDAVDNGDEPRCASCGCSELDPCEGGCVWASATLCSRCV